MKKPTYYHHENPESELSIFINKNNSITIEIHNDLYSFIALTVEDIEDIIIELQKLVDNVKNV